MLIYGFGAQGFRDLRFLAFSVFGSRVLRFRV